MTVAQREPIRCAIVISKGPPYIIATPAWRPKLREVTQRRTTLNLRQQQQWFPANGEVMKGRMNSGYAGESSGPFQIGYRNRICTPTWKSMAAEKSR